MYEQAPAQHPYHMGSMPPLGNGLEHVERWYLALRRGPPPTVTTVASAREMLEFAGWSVTSFPKYIIVFNKQQKHVACSTSLKLLEMCAAGAAPRASGRRASDSEPCTACTPTPTSPQLQCHERVSRFRCRVFRSSKLEDTPVGPSPAMVDVQQSCITAGVGHDLHLHPGGSSADQPAFASLGCRVLGVVF